jgi:hypothetical protein
MASHLLRLWPFEGCSHSTKKKTDMSENPRPWIGKHMLEVQIVREKGVTYRSPMVFNLGRHAPHLTSIRPDAHGCLAEDPEFLQ